MAWAGLRLAVTFLTAVPLPGAGRRTGAQQADGRGGHVLGAGRSGW